MTDDTHVTVGQLRIPKYRGSVTTDAAPQRSEESRRDEFPDEDLGALYDLLETIKVRVAAELHLCHLTVHSAKRLLHEGKVARITIVIEDREVIGQSGI